MNPLQNYNFIPTTVEGNQFLSYKQPGYYMTDYRNSSDLYAYLINNASTQGVTTGHQLRQYLQDNGKGLANEFLHTTAKQFINMQTQGPPNVCTGSSADPIYSGGKRVSQFDQQCSTPGQSCMMVWENTPLSQQGPHCQVAPKNYYSPYLLLN